MTGHDRRRIQDLLDGLLGPAQEAAVRRQIAADPDWQREEKEARAVLAFLDLPLDVPTPADLAPSVMKAVTVDRARRRFRFRLPARIENSLVLAGTAGLAALVASAPRFLAADGTTGWLGRVALGAAQSLTGGIDGLVNVVASVSHLDWFARLVTTLSGTARTVVTSSAQPILFLGLSALVFTVLVAFVLVRTEKGGGVRHAHVAI